MGVRDSGACIDHNVAMSGSAVTPPKGRATRARNDDSGRRSRISARLQWSLVVLLALIVMGAIFYFGRDVQSDFNGAGPSGVSAIAPTAAVDVGVV